MVREQVEKILKRCSKNTSEMYDDEYFLNKIRILFVANHIRDYSLNIKRVVSAANSSIFFIATEIIFDGERIYKEWMVKDISD